MTTCPKCGAPIPLPDARFCPVCGYAMLIGDQISGNPAQPGAVPWESVETLGVGPALWHTLRECLFRPHSFFDRAAHTRKAGMAFVYALILGSIGAVVGFIWTYFFMDSELFSSLRWLGELKSGKEYSTMLIFMPLIITIKVFIETIYFHVLIILSRTRHRDIKSTFIAVCYAESASVFNLVPVAGGMLSAVFSVFILAAAFSRIHRMSTGKAVAIILLPLFVLGFLLAIALAAAIGAGIFVNGIFKEF